MNHATETESPDYYQITRCTESYFDRLGDSALGMGWPNVADAVKRYDVMLDVIRNHSSTVRLLDFGCGTGHLYEHIQKSQRCDIEYHGLDLSPTFIEQAQKKHPDARFTQGDVLLSPSLLDTYDYAVINGVFTSKCAMNHEAMLVFVQRIIKLLFERVQVGIAFNAISKQVDWERDEQ